MTQMVGFFEDKLSGQYLITRQSLRFSVDGRTKESIQRGQSNSLISVHL